MVTVNQESYKAEVFCVRRNRSFEFTLLDNKREEIKATSDVINTLPKKVYGKMLTNTTGYNPEGWFEYVNINKEKINFIDKSE